MRCVQRKPTATLVALWLLAAAAGLTAAAGAPDGGQGPPAIIVAASRGTNTSAVRAVLSAAGVWLAPTGGGGGGACEQLLPPRGGGGPKQRAASGARTQLPHGCKELLASWAAQAPPGAPAWALDAGGAAHGAVPRLVQLLSSARVLHVVQDVRQQGASSEAAAGQWARANSELRAWATQEGLAAARRYSIARLEDLCSGDAAAAAAAVQAMLRHAGLSHGGGRAAAAALGQHCPPAPAALPLRASNASAVHAALAAFDYPALPPPLPRWLAAPEGMGELARVAAAWPRGAGPAVVTFVSGGYEPILNNWLAWLRDSGAGLGRVLVVTGPGGAAAVRRKLAFRGVRVLGLDAPEPPGPPAPGSSDALGRARDPTRHARAKVWLLRVRVMHELLAAGVGVVVSDLDAIWRRDAVADLLTRGGPQQQRGYDLLMSPGFFPFDVRERLGAAGCMGFLYARPTPAARRLLAAMLAEKEAQLRLVGRVKFFNDQRVLNEQLLAAAIAVNGSSAAPAGDPGAAIEGAAASTAPERLRVLFLPESAYTRVCSANASAYGRAVVVHCQSHNSGRGKMAFLRRVGLWREPAAGVV